MTELECNYVKVNISRGNFEVVYLAHNSFAYLLKPPKSLLRLNMLIKVINFFKLS